MRRKVSGIPIQVVKKSMETIKSTRYMMEEILKVQTPEARIGSEKEREFLWVGAKR